MKRKEIHIIKIIKKGERIQLNTKKTVSFSIGTNHAAFLVNIRSNKLGVFVRTCRIKEDKLNTVAERDCRYISKFTTYNLCVEQDNFSGW